MSHVYGSARSHGRSGTAPISRIKHHEAFLRYLHNATIKQKKQILRTASNEEIQTLCECAFNILRRNIPLSHSQVEKLREPKTRNLVYKLANKKISVPQKRKLVIRQTGGLGMLAPIIDTLLSTVLDHFA